MILTTSEAAGLAGLLLVLLGGCTTTLRELHLQEPSLMREAVGTPDAILECTQNYAEDHFGGLLGRLSLLSYETRSDGPARHLVARAARQPANVVFNLAATPFTTSRVVIRLRIQPLSPFVESAVLEAVDACAPPAP